MKLKAAEYDEGRGMLLEGSQVLARFDTIETAREAAKAMNSHSELINALETAIRWLRRLEDGYPGCLNDDAIAKHLQPALDKAKGNP